MIQQVFVHDGWLVVYYVGLDPCVVYGCTALGPDFRLDLKLSNTNDQLAIENNTSPITLAAPELRQHLGDHFSGGYSSFQVYYTVNGGTLHYNLTATDMDICAYSETDILSMVEGGPYAFDKNMTVNHVGNVTGVDEIPPGYFYIRLTGHQSPDSEVSFVGDIEPR